MTAVDNAVAAVKAGPGADVGGGGGGGISFASMHTRLDRAQRRRWMTRRPG